MTEVELKSCSDRGSGRPFCRIALAALGFVPGETVRETDLYFNGGDRDFRRTDEALACAGSPPAERKMSS